MMLYAMAKDTGATILSIEYRKAPENPYPLPGQDCFEAYKWLLQKVGDSSRIVVAGDSAGGALAIDVVLMARDGQLPRPGGSILLSPWVDLVDDYNPSLVRNQPYDVIPAYLIPYVGSMYIDPSKANSVSAVNRDLKDFPPVLVEVGDSEILQDQIMKLVEKLQSDGSSSTEPYVECNTYTDMVHVFQMLAITKMPQISQSFQRMKAFLDKLDTLNNCVTGPVVSEKMERELPPLTVNDPERA